MTDTERLDWLEQSKVDYIQRETNYIHLWKSNSGGVVRLGAGRDLKTAIDAAMKGEKDAEDLHQEG